MKKLFSSLVLIGALSFVACNNEKKADTAEKTDGTEKVETSIAPAAMAVTAHVCSAECKEGNHMFAHNEVGHTCTEACGAAHVCTDKCTDGNHMQAHGEVGHTCTEDCAKM